MTTDPNVSRPLDAGAAALVVLLCLSWGLNQVAVKVAIPDIPPLVQGAIRSGGSGALVLLWCWLRGIPLFRRDGTLKGGLLSGLFFGLEFLLIYRGLLWTTASRAIIFLYLAPVLVPIGGRIFLPADRFAPSQWIGLLLAFAGIAVAFGLPSPAADPNQMTGDLLLVGAAFLWAANTLAIKGSALTSAPPEKTLIYQTGISVLILAAAAVFFGEQIEHAPSALSTASVAFQTVWVVAVTYVIWFSLIARYSASRLSAFTFLTPLFGVAAGHLLLGDPLTPGFLLAVCLVIAGLFLVNRPR